MAEDRRDKVRRADVVRCVLDRIVRNPGVTLTADTLRQWLQVPVDAAERILRRLVDSGLMREVRQGVWVRGTWPGQQL
jgi:hypothetical protein